MKTKSKSRTLHYPRLDTMLMVEEFVKKHSGEFRKKQLWERMPRKIMYQTFNVIFEYLKSSNKIAVDREAKVCWIWNPALVRKYLSSPELAFK